MEIYQSEEQQVEAIKSYWKTNGKSIMAGLFIGLVGFIGYNKYQESQLETQINASDAYQTVLELENKDQATYVSAAEKFINENDKTSYAALTALALAKEEAKKENWQKSAEYLTSAVASAPNEGIKGIATVRLARVQVQQAEFEQALTTLATPLAESFTAVAAEIKGDAFLKLGKTDQARNAYQQAIDADVTNPTLQMKFDDLAEVINLPSAAK